MEGWDWFTLSAWRQRHERKAGFDGDFWCTAFDRVGFSIYRCIVIMTDRHTDPAV
jgi:hypothetical protein